MPAPGVTVNSTALRALRGAPTDTGVLFVVGPTSASPTGQAVELSSIAEYTTKGLGTRTGPAAVVYDALEVFFAEGGATAYVSRTTTGATPVTVADALNAFGSALGPGQVIAPGDVTAHAALLTHAAATNRKALLDGGGTVQIGALPGAGSPREVPPSAFVAGLIARNDAERSVNDAPAGDRGYLRTAIGITKAVLADAIALAGTTDGLANAEHGALFVAGDFTDFERGQLDDARINPIRTGFDGIQLYGFSGLTDDWTFFTNSRLRMALTARLSARAEQFLFQSISPELLAELRSVLTAELDREYQAGSLFGDSADDAYDVDVSSAVNTPATIAAGELHAVVLARFAPYAERVRIDLIKAPVDGPAF